MKRIDKLVLKSFIGPFILTFLVVVFILLMQHMLKYFDDIIGKGLGWEVVGQLLFYFAIFMTPVAMPLAVLLSSLIAFGNLGEHFELTAIKSAGISLLRTLQPIFFFVLVLTGVAFYANNNLVPQAALEAYSLLYDIKQKKPALDLREGTFYNGIPNVSIKVNKKFPKDDEALKEIIVYDHSKNDGNKEVIVADSGRMSTILNERYLKFELFDGYNYAEGARSEQEITGRKSGRVANETLTRSRFTRSEVIFDLSSYDLKRTDKKWFESNRIMRNLKELDYDIDSIDDLVLQQRLNYYTFQPTYFRYLNKKASAAMPPEVQRFREKRDSLNQLKYVNSGTGEKPRAPEKSLTVAPIEKTVKVAPVPEKKASKAKRPGGKPAIRKATDQKTAKPAKQPVQKQVMHSEAEQLAMLDSIFGAQPTYSSLQAATNMARQVKSQVENSKSSIEAYSREKIVFEIQWHKIIASSMACIAMFLIGAPLGAIIKRGGLGVPFLVSILFFIVYYLLTMQGEKLAKQEVVSAWLGVWAADIILLAIGVIFLRQARIDARLFDADFYRVVLDRINQWFRRRRQARQRSVSSAQ